MGEAGRRCVEQLTAEGVRVGAGDRGEREAEVQGPSDLSATLASFLTCRPDWCISRQRAWGMPIPALLHKHTKKAFTSRAFVDAVADLTAADPDAYWKATVSELAVLPPVSDLHAPSKSLTCRWPSCSAPRTWKWTS